MSFDLVFPTAAVNDFLRVSCVEFLVQICTSFAALLCFVKWVVSQVMVVTLFSCDWYCFPGAWSAAGFEKGLGLYDPVES